VVAWIYVGSLGSDSFSGKVQEPIRLLKHKSFRQGHGGGVIKKRKWEGRRQSKTGKMKKEGESPVYRHGGRDM
jgi:hypothetical protein